MVCACCFAFDGSEEACQCFAPVAFDGSCRLFDGSCRSYDGSEEAVDEEMKRPREALVEACTTARRRLSMKRQREALIHVERMRKPSINLCRC
jgi:hypothetical protein